MNVYERAYAAGVDGFLHAAEAEMLAELASGRDVLEIGSYRGLSAWCMAQTAKSVTCVDTFRAWTNGQTQAEEVTTLDAFLRAIRGLQNVTHYVGTSEAATATIRGKFGMVFLDAMHTYEDVKADIVRWRPRVARRGWLVLHDYAHKDFPGVKEAADEVLGEAPHTCFSLAWWRKP